MTFEGIEGCGKSTQAARLAARLKESGVSAILTLEPGGTRVGQEIRHILLDARNQGLSSLAELLLYEADRAHHVQTVIKPQLKQGNWVVCDRFFDATTAYQGYARGQDIAFIKALNKKASGGILPDLTFLIDCPVEVGLHRALRRNELSRQNGQDRFEREKRDFHMAVRQGYLTIAQEEKERFLVLDGTLKTDDLERVIFDHIRPFIRKRC